MAGTWAADAGIALDHRADVPIGVQLDWGVRAAIAAGRMRPGERLPALRDLADALGVNHNTLRAAVAKLEAEGLLERRHGSGTFVAPDAAAHERHAPLVEQVARWAADAGLSPRDVAAALYVRGSAVPEPDPVAEERRALREDIAMLERMLVQLEGPKADRPEPQPPGGGRARMLTADDLRAERQELVRRLAAAQRAFDEQGHEELPQEAVAPEPSTSRRPRRAPVARPQPT